MQRQRLREAPDGLPVMRQRWAGLGFFHWKVDPGMIASRLPEGLHVDTRDHAAWLGVVPFFMQRVRPAALPALPWLSWFLELNVRTYVHDDEGRAGVWFFSLDANQPIAVELARRLFHLPYEHAAMDATVSHDRIIHYRCRRKSQPTSAICRYPEAGSQSGEPALADTLEWFLCERYLLFSSSPGKRIFTGRVHHAPYRITRLDPADYPGTTVPLAWNGFPIPDRPPDSALTAAPVDVRVFPLRASR